jgi:hypothetical protein
MGVNKTVNFDDRDVADISPSTNFGRATASEDTEMDKVD